MKKNIFLIITFILTTIFLLLFNHLIKESLSEITFSFLNNYIPCILPFSLLYLLLINDINYDLLFESLKRKRLKFIFDILIIFICIIVGTPSNAILLNKLSKSKIYSKEKVEDILINYGTISLPFIYSITHKNLFFIFVLLLINTISYLLTKEKLNLSFVDYDTSPISLKSSIISSFVTIYLFVCICVLISIPIKLITTSPLLIIALGLFETTFPCISLINDNYYLYSFFILSFSSFSLIYQLKKNNTNYPIKKHIKKRLFIASLIYVIMLIFY